MRPTDGMRVPSVVDAVELDRLARRVRKLTPADEAAAIARTLQLLPEHDERLTPWRQRFGLWIANGRRR